MPLTFEPIPVPLHLDETGTVRVAGSRVTLDIVLGSYLNGEAPEEIAADFPSLSAADIHAVVSYYLRHRPEVDAYLKRRRHEAEALHSTIDADPDNWAFRERLKARRAEMEAERRAALDRG
ncbi:MAG: DUF433 domain-containing protein [Geminicoccales bacterium]